VKCGDGIGTDLPARVFTKSSTGFDMRKPLAGMTKKRRAPMTLAPIGILTLKFTDFFKNRWMPPTDLI